MLKYLKLIFSFLFLTIPRYFWNWKPETKISFMTLLITAYIGWMANGISENQSSIMSQQSKIMQGQTSLQEKFLDFEKRKFWSEIAKKSEEEANKLFDLSMAQNRETFQAVYAKIKDNNKVENLQSLDWFVSEFENIGRLYCNWEMQYNDLNGVLKGVIEPVCWNSQIYFYYQNTKSGLAGLCKALFPKWTVMSKYADPSKCQILKEQE